MKRSRNRSLQVCLNGRYVGLYSKLKNGGVTFQYDQSWLNWNGAIPISQSMPLQAKAYSGDVVSRYFENLLPDSDLVLRKIAEKIGADGRDAFSLLAKIGRDCVGALQFLHLDEVVQPISKPRGRRLKVKDINYILENLERAPLGIEANGGFRISLAGAASALISLRCRKARQWLWGRRAYVPSCKTNRRRDQQHQYPYGRRLVCRRQS